MSGMGKLKKLATSLLLSVSFVCLNFSLQPSVTHISSVEESITFAIDSSPLLICHKLNAMLFAAGLGATVIVDGLDLRKLTVF